MTLRRGLRDQRQPGQFLLGLDLLQRHVARQRPERFQVDGDPVAFAGRRISIRLANDLRLADDDLSVTL